MKHKLVEARNLKTGMVIIPPLRTMRHAVVEKIKCSDSFQNSYGVVLGAIPADMRNHDTSYVVVQTDIGPRSFEADAGGQRDGAGSGIARKPSIRMFPLRRSGLY